jgi:hypothetical protein
MTDGMLGRKLRALWRLLERFGALPRLAGADGEGEGEGGEDAGEGGGESAETPASLDRLMESFETFKGEVSGRFDTLSKQIPKPSADEEDDGEGDDEDFEGYSFDFEDNDFDETGDLTPDAQMRALQGMIQQAVADAQRPMLEQQAAERRMSQSNALEDKYPQLKEDDFQDEMIEKTIAFAKQIGAPALAREPALLEIVYLAHRAQEKAGDEVSAGDEREVKLEHGGAARANAAGERDDGDAIVKAAGGGKFRLKV